MDEKLKFPDDMVSDKFIKYINSNEIKGLVSSLAHTISEKYKDEELVVIGVLHGSFVFFADLIREIKNVRLYVDFVKFTSVGRDKEQAGTIRILKDISVNILNKNVLIIEEIIDTGRTLEFMKGRLEKSAPKKVETLTLFDKPYKRAVNVKADYIGKKVDDQFLVGYGLDLEDYGRNLEDVYYLQFPQ